MTHLPPHRGIEHPASASGIQPRQSARTPRRGGGPAAEPLAPTLPTRAGAVLRRLLALGGELLDEEPTIAPSGSFEVRSGRVRSADGRNGVLLQLLHVDRREPLGEAIFTIGPLTILVAELAATHAPFWQT